MQLRKLLLAIVFALFCFLAILPTTEALSGSDWQAGRIIDDSVFFNGNTMSPQQIQLFLNSKVPVCDTNGTQARGNTTRAAYGASAGYPAPYTCLKDYTENTPTKPADGGLCGQYNGGNKSSAQIIYDVGVACGVNQKVLLVLLQKEQSLITDDWPWSTQYRSATGYGCPDTAPCDANYYGFFNQVYNAAHQFKSYDINASKFRYRSNRDNFIQYSPNCSTGSNVYIQNQATAGLYNYTPYQPNATALSNLVGSQTDGCSAYGNRNFWKYFNEWFGSVDGPAYSWQLLGMEFYADPAQTQRLSFEPTVRPGGKIYVRISARNNGYLPWNPSFMRLGTSNPRDHASPYRDTSWLYPTRPAQLVESSVEPSQTGTFKFSITTPQTPGAYKEYFGLVAEGSTWLNDLGAYYSFNVVNSILSPNPNITTLTPGQSLNVNDSLISPGGQASLSLESNGALILSQDYQPYWQTPTAGQQSRALVMQQDGNLVLYDANGRPLWYTGTGGNPGARLSLQLDGNLVIYSQSNTPLWSTNSVHNPDYLSYVNSVLYPGKLLRGQWLETADRRYRMVLQLDGNLVIYSQQKAIWSTRTNGSAANNLAMQQDGNLVLYDANGRPLWQSGTGGRGISALVMQQDGNLVAYQGMITPTWSTGTGGQ